MLSYAGGHQLWGQRCISHGIVTVLIIGTLLPSSLGPATQLSGDRDYDVPFPKVRGQACTERRLQQVRLDSAKGHPLLQL